MKVCAMGHSEIVYDDKETDCPLCSVVAILEKERERIEILERGEIA